MPVQKELLEDLVLEFVDLERLAQASEGLPPDTRETLDRMRNRLRKLLRGGVPIPTAAQLLRVSPAAVRKWVAAGELVVHGTGRSTRVDTEDLVDLLLHLPHGRQGKERPFAKLLHERVPATLRHASAEVDLPASLINAWGRRGLVHLDATRQLSSSEMSWLTSHAELADALWETTANDPAIDVAAVTGSVARGEETAHSDLDLIIDGPIRSSAEQLARLRGNLTERTGREVQLIGLDALEASPSLARTLLASARVITDPSGLLSSRARLVGDETNEERAASLKERAALVDKLRRA